MKCQQCGLEFFCPPLVGGAKFYEMLSKHPWYYLHEKWEYREALRDISPSDRVIEVGAGGGYFLQLLQERGIRSVGLDINEAIVKRNRDAGLAVYPMTIEEFADEEANRGHDVVCSFQVLEHLPNPRDYFRACLNLLRRGGRIIVSTPNQDSFIRLSAHGLLNMPPHHQSRWRVGVYERTAEIFGIQLVKVAYEPLASYHTRTAIYAWFNTLARFPADLPDYIHKNNPLTFRLMAGLLARLGEPLLNLSGLRHLIRGHSIYVVFEKM